MDGGSTSHSDVDQPSIVRRGVDQGGCVGSPRVRSLPVMTSRCGVTVSLVAVALVAVLGASPAHAAQREGGVSGGAESRLPSRGETGTPSDQPLRRSAQPPSPTPTPTGTATPTTTPTPWESATVSMTPAPADPDPAPAGTRTPTVAPLRPTPRPTPPATSTPVPTEAPAPQGATATAIPAPSGPPGAPATEAAATGPTTGDADEQSTRRGALRASAVVLVVAFAGLLAVLARRRRT